MFDPPSSHQAAINLYYRGPEWAIAVRQGDRQALQWALERCSQFWNGANTLLIPIRRDGRFPKYIADLLDDRPVEACYVHESVPVEAQKRAAHVLGTDRVQNWGPAWDGFDDGELHPLFLQPRPESDARRSIRIPRFPSARNELICLAVWGHIDDVDLPYYRGYFDVASISAQPEAHAAMLSGQLNGTSPLEQTMALMESYGSLPIGRALFVFESGSFNEILHFWNLRCRLRDVRNRPMLLGVARESLQHPLTLEPLVRFLSNDNAYAQKPDLGVITSRPEQTEEALIEIGFEKETGSTVSRQIGGQRGERPLSFGYFRPTREGSFQLGALVRDQVTVAYGATSFRPITPPNFPEVGRSVRIGIEGLPLPMPLTRPIAEGISSNASISEEGLTLKTSSWIGQSYLRLPLPDPWKALEGWAATRDETVALSPPGHYGQALLDRLGTLDSLASLANEKALSVLEALTPLSRRKLAQKVVAEAAKQGQANLDEQLLAELLLREARFLDLQARSAADIAGLVKVEKRGLLAAIYSLVKAGFLVRGAAVRCPRCSIEEVLFLVEQSEQVRCRACRHEHLLPVLERDGKSERPVVYQLDGLMARAMDQDLLPVLLTLHACLPDPSLIRAAWLGLEFAGYGDPKEHDLLLSDGTSVWVAECKKTASITDKQLKGLLDFTDRHRARPVLAALTGRFHDEHREAITARDGLVLERPQLLS